MQYFAPFKELLVLLEHDAFKDQRLICDGRLGFLNEHHSLGIYLTHDLHFFQQDESLAKTARTACGFRSWSVCKAIFAYHQSDS